MKKSVMFTRKKHPRAAIAGTAMAVLSGICFAVMIGISAGRSGEAGIYVGAVGVAALLMSIVGLVISIKSFLKEDVFYLFPIIGTVLNVAVVIVMMVTYGMGVMS